MTSPGLELLAFSLLEIRPPRPPGAPSNTSSSNAKPATAGIIHCCFFHKEISSKKIMSRSGVQPRSVMGQCWLIGSQILLEMVKKFPDSAQAIVQKLVERFVSFHFIWKRQITHILNRQKDYRIVEMILSTSTQSLCLCSTTYSPCWTARLRCAACSTTWITEASNRPNVYIREYLLCCARVPTCATLRSSSWESWCTVAPKMRDKWPSLVCCRFWKTFDITAWCKACRLVSVPWAVRRPLIYITTIVQLLWIGYQSRLIVCTFSFSNVVFSLLQGALYGLDQVAAIIAGPTVVSAAHFVRLSSRGGFTQSRTGAWVYEDVAQPSEAVRWRWICTATAGVRH